MTDEGERLPCGTESLDLLAQVCDGHGRQFTAHQTTCPHCPPVLAEYERLWAPFEALAEEPTPAPRAIIDRAVSYVRALAADPHRTLLPLDERSTNGAGVPGGAWVGARVVIRSARLAAEGVQGVRLALSRLEVGTSPVVGPGDGHSDEVAVLEMTVAADYGQDLRELGRRIRAEVTERVHAATGVRPASVSVHIDDVLL